MEYFKEKFVGLNEVPKGIGAILKGWDIEEVDYRSPDTQPIIDFRAMTAVCPYDCFHCFTDKSKKTLTIDEIKDVIDQLAQLQTHSIDFLGEGEPTIDEDFFEIIEHTASHGIQPVIFTDAATRLRDREFVRRLNNTAATIIPKCDSLFNADYQNWVVSDKTGKFFERRNEALKLLIEEGFNEDQNGKTRLGFDMVVTKRNAGEVEKTLRFCRENNIWIAFTFFLPSGRSGQGDFDQSLSLTETEKGVIRQIVQEIDKEEYGFDHVAYSNFITVPCMETLQICGNGDVTPCPGNETVIGNIRNSTIKEIRALLMRQFPCHNPTNFDGHCLYR